jgi:hypothetical protein
MNCNRLSGSRSLRHDDWKEALGISTRAGCCERTEPSYASVGFEVTLHPPHGPSLLDISMIQSRCSTYIVAASQMRGAASPLRDRSKYQAHAGHLLPGHTFVPVSIEMLGYIRKPIMPYLRTRGDMASAHSLAVTRGSFLC